MAKQLTIICSSEISDMVTKTLSKSGIQGFVHIKDATGTMVEEKGPYTHDLTWPAEVFIVPAGEEQLRPIIEKLKDYAGKCEIQPCLKLILTPIEEFY